MSHLRWSPLSERDEPGPMWSVTKQKNRNNGGTYHLQRKIKSGWKIKCFAPFLLGSFRKYGMCFEVMHFFRINLGFRGNGPPTPPLNQHFALDEKKGRGRLVCLYRCFYFTPRILRVRWATVSSLMDLTWENNREFATRWNDVWGMNAKNSILMTSHYPDLGGASDWLKQVSLLARLTQIRVETRHQCGISALIPQTSFRGEM